MAKKRKPGRKKDENPRLPVHWRVRTSTLIALRKRAEAERRNINAIAEMILEEFV